MNNRMEQILFQCKSATKYGLIIIKTKWPNLYFFPFFSKDKVEISCVDILKKLFYEPLLQQQQKKSFFSRRVSCLVWVKFL